MELSIKGIEFGDKVKHIVHGFEGIVESVAVYDTGCTHILVKPMKLTKEGKVREGTWFDIEKLKKVPNSKRLKLVDRMPKGKKNGGPGKSHPSPRSYG